MPKVTAKARSREDRAGDPLDGLVNLFDIGIILSVAFLLAALSSLDLTEVITDPDRSQNLEQQNTAPADSVVTNPDETTEQITIEPGQTVVGQGEPLGTVYQLEDGRTILVKPGTTGAAGATGTTGSVITP